MKKSDNGGYCQDDENSLSFIRLKEKLQFETFEEFCSRADEILNAFKVAVQNPRFSWKEYKNYIYHQHKFSHSHIKDLMAKDKCFEWIMSYQYEYISKNDLYSILGILKKERK